MTLLWAFLSALSQQPPPVARSDTGGRSLQFDFPGLQVGVAEYDDGPTGTTVFYFPKGVKAAVDARGGAPGTVNSDAVRLGYESPMMEAVVFAGGSWYGLSAATGVANEIKAIRAERGEHDFVAGVVAAIIYDVGGRRFSRVTPDDRLGRAALRAAREGSFPQGARGAGRFAMQGVYFLPEVDPDHGARWPHSGQGGAFRQVGPTKIAVFTVVNALGTVVDRSGRVVRCRRSSDRIPCPAIEEMLRDRLARQAASGGDGAAGPGKGPSGNTTISLVVTNQKLPYWALQRLAVQVHSSMARAIQPIATEEDGDVLYAVTTDEIENPALQPIDLTTIASEVAWDAILASVPELPAPPARTAGSARSLGGLPGEYLFPGGGKFTVATAGQGLEATFTGNGRIYFTAGRRYPLVPAGDDLFVVDGPGDDVIRFDRQGGRVIGLTLNPGRWGEAARRSGAIPQ